MRGVSALIWAVLVLGIVLGMMALFMTKMWYGPNGPEQGAAAFQEARDFDAKTRSHLEDLGIKFAPTDSREPTLNLEKPSDADFAFLEGLLQTNDPKGRLSAAKVLRDIGAPRSVEPLMAAARGVDPQMDSFFVECALTILRDKSPEQYRETLIPPFERHRENLEPELIAVIQAKLREAGAWDAAFLREAAVSDRESAVRRFAVAALAAEKRPPLGVLAAAMGDPDEAVRKQARVAMEALHREPPPH